MFIRDAESIPSALGELLGGLISVAAQDIEVTLTPLSGAGITAVKTGGKVEGSTTAWK